MPAITVGPPRSEQMWQALKAHITRERQRKKQEQEADAEEERQRKERERQQKQDVMTLGETREQISNLENELSQLKDEKHQLFLQLKKVLNEDDNRRRQLIRENSVCSEVLTAVGYPGAGPRVVHPQLFLPLPRSSSPLYKVIIDAPPHTFLPTGPLRRMHSPSPPPTASPYHAGYGYKPTPSMPSYNPPPSKSEEAARRSGDSRAVLWNKNNQYSASNFYSAPTGQSVYSYSAPTSQQSREPEPAKSVYLSGNKATLSTHQTGAYAEDKFYLRPGSHVTVHGGAIPIQQPPQGAKTGGITSGYPVRAPQPPPAPYPPPPPGTYVSASGANVPGRLLYTQPPARYLQREI
ncbi:unnamed protein product [Xylocopa violacea]|uniref:G protein pathway suppressor 2 n=1 Tax=Xylocopa violacea TaxID=135666 RepID=A0ABP1PCV9_XYLVO